jgi:hypothetical protein
MTIVDKLRDRAYSTKAGDELCEEAAALIESLTWRDRVKDNIINRLTIEIGRLGKGAVKSRETVRSDGPRSTNHDAAPEATAYADGEPEPKRGGEAGLSSRDGTGNTPSKAEIDALQFVVEEGRTASVGDYGVLRSWLIRLRPEWESQSYEEKNEKRTNTTMGRDDTPSDGSVQSRCALTDEEREAIRTVIDAASFFDWTLDCEWAATTESVFRKLLARLS